MVQLLFVKKTDSKFTSSSTKVALTRKTESNTDIRQRIPILRGTFQNQKGGSYEYQPIRFVYIYPQPIGLCRYDKVIHIWVKDPITAKNSLWFSYWPGGIDTNHINSNFYRLAHPPRLKFRLFEI
jgi:hypothetical protein